MPEELENQNGNLEEPEAPENQDDLEGSSTEDQGDEYSQYLQSLGIDPSDPATVAMKVKEFEEKVNQLSETAASYEAVVQQLAQQQARQQSQPQQPQVPDEPEQAWEHFTSQNPYAVIQSTAQQVAQQIAQQTIQETMLQSTLAAEEARLIKQYGPAETQLIKGMAQQLITTNPTKYQSKPVNLAVSEVFKDAEEMVKQQAMTFAKLAGFKPGAQAAAGAAASVAAPAPNRPGPKKKDAAKLAELEAKHKEALKNNDPDALLDVILEKATLGV